MAAKRSARPRPFKPPLTPSPPPSTLSSPPSPSVLPTLLSWQFGLYLVIGLAIRFWNFSQSQYFIWDQGRDIWQIQAIINGDFTLIGPTTGIAGFFLGPIWFYLGVPGLLLGGGSPWVLNAWFILVASLSLPFFWLLSHQLFGNKRWAMLNAYLLTLVPGSITGSLTIWNPLLSLPLMAGAIWTLLQARRSLPHLLLSFFLLGLALQSEFAYAVFLVGPLWLAIPWLRSKFKWQEMALSAVVIGVTLFPQLLFEFRHNLVMTNGVIASLSDQSQQIDWATLWRQRPGQLISASSQLLFRGIQFSRGWLIAAFGLVLWWSWRTWRSQRSGRSGDHRWQVLALIWALPYLFYLVWRGNNGFFFDYYITPHFILWVPLVMAALSGLVSLARTTWQKLATWGMAVALVAAMITASIHHLDASVFRPVNRAGLDVMQRSIDQLYDWQLRDDLDQATVRIYVPGVRSEHYDSLLTWRAKQLGLPVAHTVRQANDQVWYVLREPTPDQLSSLFDEWYQEATAGG